jgi:hypothetical protein
MKIKINERFYKNKDEQETSDSPKPEAPDTEVEGGGIEAPEASAGGLDDEEEPEEGEDDLDMGDDLELEEDAMGEACAACGDMHDNSPCGPPADLAKTIPIRMRIIMGEERAKRKKKSRLFWKGKVVELNWLIPGQAKALFPHQVGRLYAKEENPFFEIPRASKWPTMSVKDKKRRKSRQDQNKWVPPIGTSVATYTATFQSIHKPYTRYDRDKGDYHSPVYYAWTIPGHEPGMSDEEVEAIYAAGLKDAEAKDKQIEDEREEALDHIGKQLNKAEEEVVARGGDKSNASQLNRHIITMASNAINSLQEGNITGFNGMVFQMRAKYIELLSLGDFSGEGDLQYPDNVHWSGNFNKRTASSWKYQKKNDSRFYRE